MWPGLTYSNASKYFPRAGEMTKCHMIQSSQGVQSTKKKKNLPLIVTGKILKYTPGEEDLEDIPPPIKTNELHIWDKPISKLYTDYCGRFPIWLIIRNNHIRIAYYCDSNTILQEQFSNIKNKHRIRAYILIMKRLADRWHKVDVQILDNEVSAEFKRVIVDNWGATYPLVPTNVHRRNISEQDIFYQSWPE